ncbi:MAG TPA: hypothetical protein VF188_02275 [Longimicrobiales bacterium]
MARKATRRQAAIPLEGGVLRFTRINWIFLGLGIAAVALGYFFLAHGSTVAAPLLLVLGYAVLIPIGIIKSPPRHETRGA